MHGLEFEVERGTTMILLILALLFGIALLIFLLKILPGTKQDLRGSFASKIKGLLEIILLIEDIIYIAVFVVVLVKTFLA